MLTTLYGGFHTDGVSTVLTRAIEKSPLCPVTILRDDSLRVPG